MYVCVCVCVYTMIFKNSSRNSCLPQLLLFCLLFEFLLFCFMLFCIWFCVWSLTIRCSLVSNPEHWYYFTYRCDPNKYFYSGSQWTWE